MTTQTISAAVPEKRRVDVHGLEMAYVDVGSGRPVVFLHGNPTSSYLWRNIIPHVSDGWRCVAPDLIGMGDSEKLPSPGVFSYTYAQHRRYLDGFLDAVFPDEQITFVIHDWGSTLGFDWARRHPERVAGIAYMEAVVTPLEWSDFPEAFRPTFEAFRSTAGEAMVLDDNVFVEQVFPAAIVRKLSDEEMDVYRAPFAEQGEGRRPTLTWPRQLPIAGEPTDVIESVAANAAFMKTASFPKLLVRADPGAILVGRALEECRAWPNQTEVTVPGIHFVQEDCPHEIGAALREWLAGV